MKTIRCLGALLLLSIAACAAESEPSASTASALAIATEDTANLAHCDCSCKLDSTYLCKYSAQTQSSCDGSFHPDPFPSNPGECTAQTGIGCSGYRVGNTQPDNGVYSCQWRLLY